MPANRRLLWTFVLIGSLVALALASRIATQQLIVGSREGHWLYPYVRTFSYRSLRVWLIATGLAGALLAAPNRVYVRREWLMVAMWVVVGFGLQALLRSALTRVALDRMFVSDTANSFYGVTLHYPASAVLGDFERLRAFWPLHAQSNMPGKIILIYALEFISTRPTVLAWLVVLLSNLGGVFLYLFVRDLFADRLVALFSLILYLFVPAKLFFFPLLNTVTPVIVFLCAFLLLRWLRGGQARYAGLLGVALYGLAFFEPTALAMGLVFAALILQALVRATIPFRTFVRQGALTILAFAAMHLFMWGWSGFDLFDALRHVVTDAVAFNQNERPYWLWVRQDPLEFFFGVGFCQVFVFWAVLVGSVTGARWRERLTSPIATVGVSLAAVLLAIDLLGVNRGEITRLWIFLACTFQIPAAYVCARLQSRAAMMLILTVTLLQDALGTSMIAFITP